MIASRKKRLAIGLALTSTLGAGLLTGSANADPQQYAAFVGVGSDTTEGVMNAMAGYSNGRFYTPIASNPSTVASTQGSLQIISFDASKAAFVGDNCITAKIGGPAFFRPNGSGAGQKALNQSAGLGGGWTGAGGCGVLQDISGQVDFARSSSIPGTPGTDATYIPFGRDAMSFAAFRPAGAIPVTALSRQQLVAIYNSTATSRLVVGGVTMIPCGIQTNSGTFAFWNSALGISASENAATTECTNAGVVGRIQESDGPALQAKGVALDVTLDNFQVISGFSAGNFISKTNGVGEPAPGPDVKIGSITDNGNGVNLGSPVVGTVAPLTPNATFYNDATFGRYVYNVLSTAVATGPGNAARKKLFVGLSSSVCLNTAVIETFGFLAIPDCGDISRTRAWTTGAA